MKIDHPSLHIDRGVMLPKKGHFAQVKGKVLVFKRKGSLLTYLGIVAWTQCDSVSETL